MVTTSHLVKKLLENKPFLLEGLSKGMISHSSLAEELKPKIEGELNKKVKDAAIIMALRRYSEELNEKLMLSKKFNFSGEINMKTHICDFNVLKTQPLLAKIKSLYNLVDFEKGDFLNIIVGNNEVSIVINEKHKDKLLKFLKDEKIINKEFGLVALNITFSGDFIHTPGIIFQVVRKLAWENINVFEVISTMTELTFIIGKKDSMNSYDIMDQLVK
ncbi:hypothetical protein ISS05_02145 [Candidatus Woesearchaeota archaeon]|nr:hypothetical protein [Candidatus Woesearchaeota archaeon]